MISSWLVVTSRGSSWFLMDPRAEQSRVHVLDDDDGDGDGRWQVVAGGGGRNADQSK